MQDRSEIFRRIKQQYFREQLAPLGYSTFCGAETACVRRTLRPRPPWIRGQ